MTKLTSWYPPNIKPKRKGYYQTRCNDWGEISFRDFWDGKKWLSEIDDSRLGQYLIEWRGLAEAPK